MTASAGYLSPEQEPQATNSGLPSGMAGFVSAEVAPVQKTRLTGPNMDVVDHLQRIKDGTEGTEDANERAGADTNLTEEFNNTEFMRLLAMIYGINEIPTPLAAPLSSIKLDSSKPKPVDYTGTIYAIADGVNVEITKDSVLADESTGPLTPEVAYKMAAAAALNPAMKTLTLNGNEEDRAMLMWAAKHFDLDVTDESIPSIPADKVDALAQKFAAFEQAMGFEHSVVADLLGTDAPEPATVPEQPAPRQERREPRMSTQPAFA